MTSEPQHSDREERTKSQSDGDRDTEATAEQTQREREIQQWAERVVDAMPPLTTEQRERLALLLRTTR